jgi:hypothetical protein
MNVAARDSMPAKQCWKLLGSVLVDGHQLIVGFVFHASRLV